MNLKSTIILALAAMTCNYASAVAPKFVPKSFLSNKGEKPQPIKPTPSYHNACAIQIAKEERAHGIPTNLMQAIAKVESGKKVSGGKFVAWPWTVNAKGKSYYYQTKAEAVREVKKLQKQGVRSIDVGCMQINLRHHPDAFKNIEAAFDPRQNVAYAASHLKALHDRFDWETAVKYYHSTNPKRHNPYHTKVLAMLDEKQAVKLRKTTRVTSLKGTKIAQAQHPRPQAFKVVPSRNGNVLVAMNRPKVKRVSSHSGAKVLSPSSRTMGAVKRINTKK